MGGVPYLAKFCQFIYFENFWHFKGGKKWPNNSLVSEKNTLYIEYFFVILSHFYSLSFLVRGLLHHGVLTWRNEGPTTPLQTDRKFQVDDDSEDMGQSNMSKENIINLKTQRVKLT